MDANAGRDQRLQCLRLRQGQTAAEYKAPKHLVPDALHPCTRTKVLSW